MVLRKYISTISLCFLLIGLIRQSYRDPVDPGLWLTLSCFVGFALFVQILVSVGIMEISGPKQEATRVRLGNSQQINDYRYYHYKSIVAKIQSSGVTVTNVEDAIKTYSSLFNVGEKAARPFFHNQFVMATLGLNIKNTAQVAKGGSTRDQKTKQVDPRFWDNVSKGVARNEAKSDEACAAPGCSKTVSAFDFRCFKCRSRFCGDCETGKRIMCKACS